MKCNNMYVFHVHVVVCAYGMVISITAVVAVILTLILYTLVLLLMKYCVCNSRRKNDTK